MPSYDFVCRDCSASFEVRLSISDYSAGKGRACPECSSHQVDRAFTTVNVIAGSRSGSTGPSGARSCGSSGFT